MTIQPTLGRQIVDQTHGMTGVELRSVAAHARNAQSFLQSALLHLRELSDEGASVRDGISDIAALIHDEIDPLLDNAEAEAERVEGIEQEARDLAFYGRPLRVA